MNDNLRRALEALERGAHDARAASTIGASALRNRINRTVDEVLTHLEAEDVEPEDTMSRLDRKSKEIAEDLRRIDRLMRERLGGE